jgi:hypothetical protein
MRHGNIWNNIFYEYIQYLISTKFFFPSTNDIFLEGPNLLDFEGTTFKLPIL